MALLKSGGLVSKLTRWDPTEKQAKIIQWALEARRLKILLDRTAAGMYHSHSPNTRKQPTLEEARKSLVAEQIIESPIVEQHSKMFPNSNRKRLRDFVAIIDMGLSTSKGNGIDTILLPFIPRELEYNIDSSFVSIKPIGRNNPGYHYTGSEDRLEFEIDWHSTNENRYDVIEKCRKIEALSKSDSYNSPPHYVALQWGKDNILFRDHLFVIISASYKLVQFSKGHINQSGAILNTSMLPIQAYQKVTLSRVTSNNLSSIQIQGVS